jgi:hypothetical protein
MTFGTSRSRKVRVVSTVLERKSATTDNAADKLSFNRELLQWSLRIWAKQLAGVLT